MKVIEQPKHFAPKINFRQMPIVQIDVAETDEYGLRGAPVLIDNGFFRTGEPNYIRAQFRTFNDENVLVFQSYGIMLADTFTYEDMEEMMEYANAPLIRPGEDFMVVFIDSKKRTFSAPITVTAGNRISQFCMTPLELTEKVHPVEPTLKIIQKGRRT